MAGFALVNLTGVNSDVLRGIVEFARGRVNPRGVTVVIRRPEPSDRRVMHGYCLPSWCRGSDQALIVIDLSRVASMAGQEIVYRSRYPRFGPQVQPWRLSLLGLVAHEWAHVQQWQRARRRRCEPRRWAARRIDFPRETAAEAYALRMQAAFALQGAA